MSLSPTCCHRCLQDLSLLEFQMLGQLAASQSQVLPTVLRKFWDTATLEQHEEHSPWQCSEDDGFPTLEMLFRDLPVSERNWACHTALALLPNWACHTALILLLNWACHTALVLLSNCAVTQR